VIRCRNCSAISETVFAAELVACSEPVLAAELGNLSNWAACSEPVLAADFYNKPPRQK